MPKTPDEIKKGLECCLLSCSGKCPYSDQLDCSDKMSKDALALIQQLEAQNAEQAERIRVLEDHFREVTKKVEQLQAERDAAVNDIYEMAGHVTCEVCDWCDQTECECGCMESDTYEGFKWRGVQKEE